MPIDLTRDEEKAFLESIRAFFADHLDEEIGELKSRLVLDYVLKEIAPTAYNRGVADAQAYLQDKVAEVDVSIHLPERTYRKR